jgi:hypothetical protein
LNLPPKLGHAKRNLLASFLKVLLKNLWVKSTFPYVMLPHHERAKQDTIRVTRITNIRLPHHKGPMPTYPMKKKTSFIYHIIKQ